ETFSCVVNPLRLAKSCAAATATLVDVSGGVGCAARARVLPAARVAESTAFWTWRLERKRWPASSASATMPNRNMKAMAKIGSVCPRPRGDPSRCNSRPSVLNVHHTDRLDGDVRDEGPAHRNDWRVPVLHLDGDVVGDRVARRPGAVCVGWGRRDCWIDVDVTLPGRGGRRSGRPAPIR